MAKKTKQQEIDELKDMLRSETERSVRFERDYELSRCNRNSFQSRLSDFLLKRDEVVDTGTGLMFREQERLSENGILRKIACLAERENIYRTEKEAITEKYHELVRGLAKMPENKRVWVRPNFKIKYNNEEEQ